MLFLSPSKNFFQNFAGERIKVVLAGGAVAHAKVPTGYKQGMVFQFRHDEENHAEL